MYVVGAVLTVGGFAGIMGYEFVAPRAELSRVDGVCRIGIHPDSGIAVIVLDTTINVALTAIFVWLLLPALGSSLLPNRTASAPTEPKSWSFWNQHKSRRSHQEGSSAWIASQQRLKIMLLRNVAGTSLILSATITNNVLFLTWSFAVYSHACQLMCLTDGMLQSQETQSTG